MKYPSSDRKYWASILPIINAFIEGKTIEIYLDGEWQEINYSYFEREFKYRIKDECT